MRPGCCVSSAGTWLKHRREPDFRSPRRLGRILAVLCRVDRLLSDRRDLHPAAPGCRSRRRCSRWRTSPTRFYASRQARGINHDAHLSGRAHRPPSSPSPTRRLLRGAIRGGVPAYGSRRRRPSRYAFVSDPKYGSVRGRRLLVGAHRCVALRATALGLSLFPPGRATDAFDPLSATARRRRLGRRPSTGRTTGASTTAYRDVCGRSRPTRPDAASGGAWVRHVGGPNPLGGGPHRSRYDREADPAGAGPRPLILSHAGRLL
jgi:hypothetical protein